MACITDLT